MKPTREEADRLEQEAARCAQNGHTDRAAWYRRAAREMRARLDAVTPPEPPPSEGT